MKDADRVIGNVARSLRPKGRFVAEMGCYGCHRRSAKIISHAFVDASSRIFAMRTGNGPRTTCGCDSQRT
jgi:hypothetical protein